MDEIGKHINWISERIPWSATIVSFLITLVYFYLGFATSAVVLMVLSGIVDSDASCRLSYVLLGALMLSPILYMAIQRAKHYKI
jgi:uncharacterized membrane protein